MRDPGLRPPEWVPGKPPQGHALAPGPAPPALCKLSTWRERPPARGARPHRCPGQTPGLGCAPPPLSWTAPRPGARTPTPLSWDVGILFSSPFRARGLQGPPGRGPCFVPVPRGTASAPTRRPCSRQGGPYPGDPVVGLSVQRPAGWPGQGPQSPPGPNPTGWQPIRRDEVSVPCSRHSPPPAPRADGSAASSPPPSRQLAWVSRTSG